MLRSSDHTHIYVTQAILLMGILPFVIRLGRNKYSKWALHKSSVQPAMEGLSESSRLLADRERQEEEEEDAQVQGRTANAPATDYGTSSKQNGAASTRKGKEEEENPDGTERFDLYFGALSFTIDALALVGVGLSKVTWHLYACECARLAPFSRFVTPTARHSPKRRGATRADLLFHPRFFLEKTALQPPPCWPSHPQAGRACRPSSPRSLQRL